VCESTAVRAVALFGPHAREDHLRPFAAAGVNIFSGNELDPTDQPDAALVFGGDGTLHRHLPGLALKGIPTLVVPLGSANDFANSIGMGSVATAVEAWKRYCSLGGNLHSVDLGTIQPVEQTNDGALAGVNTEAPPAPWQGESLESLHFVPSGPRRDLPQMGGRIMQSQLRRRTEAEREIEQTVFFSCIAGTGLDAAVNRLTLKQSRWLRGHGGYVLALLEVLGGFRPPMITVEVEFGGRWQQRVHEPGFLVAAGNGPQYGHGMRLTHEASMEDGLLDICFVRKLNKLRLLRLFGSVYRGAHIGLAEVEYFKTPRVRITTEPGGEVFADGEYVCRTPVEMGVRPRALRLITPVGHNPQA